MNILTDCIRTDGEYAQLLTAVKSNFKGKPLPILANGLCDGAAEAAIVALVEDSKQFSETCALIICPDEKDGVRIEQTLSRFGLSTAFFASRDISFYDITASHEYEHERLLVLSGLESGAYDAVITTPDAALGYTMPPQVLRDATLTLDFNSEVDMKLFCEKLSVAGYARVDMVDGMGQFACRGGIIDIFPPFGSFTDTEGNKVSGANALRVELFGDQIDRMGIFDTETQRITIGVSNAVIPPAREIIVTDETRTRMDKAIKAQLKSCRDDKAREELLREAAATADGGEGTEINFSDKYISLIYPEKNSLTDYFPDKTLVVVRSGAAVNDRIKASEWQMNENIKSLAEAGTVAPKYMEYSKPSALLGLFCDRNVTVHVDSLPYNMPGARLSGLFSFRTKHMISYSENFNLLCEDLDGYVRGGYRIVVITENETAAKNLRDMLNDTDFHAVVEGESGVYRARELQPGIILIKWKEYLYGFELVTSRLVVLSTNPDSRTGALRQGGYKKRKSKPKAGTRSIMSWEELEVGDLVVHETYGIGRYTGIENIVSLGVARDYIGIKYDGSDKLFLPVDQMDKVSKYIGAHADDGIIKLSKFGGDGWNKAKAKVRGALKDMAKDLIKLYASRLKKPGITFPVDDESQKEFDAAFEYEETDCQLEAINDIKADMEKPVPMDRLLCGDVGYGKTEVALRAAFKAVLGGKQVAILVPTTLLALQHYQTIISRMRSFAVSVDMVSRLRTQKQQEQTLRRLERGDLDILVGTHRLLAKDIKFHALGLLIVDEEQRFGVGQKEKLKQFAGNIDVLTLTATPIPRTLNMAMGGIRDISILDEAPGERLPVQTYVLENNELIINEAIRKELRRGGQVFYLHNEVESIDSTAARLAKAIPDARITVAHGKMDKDVLEEIWEKMLGGEVDILVCTTIIETGVDIPNANTLIVENANRLGLSQLHQIRGRVGRSSRRAYAYFTYPPDRAVSEIAQKRLEAIREYAEFGAGFRIALRDMEIRGAGNLLGAEQHGHMEAIGYDLYIKMLNEAVLEERGEKIPEKKECVISLDYDAYIPDKYIRYPAQRMALYKRIALIRNEDDLQDITDELIDRFGEPPKQAENLINIALIRARALECGITQIKQENGDINIYPERFNFPVLSELSTGFDGRLRAAITGKPHFFLRLRKGDNALALLNELFAKYTESVNRNK